MSDASAMAVLMVASEAPTWYGAGGAGHGFTFHKYAAAALLAALESAPAWGRWRAGGVNTCAT